VSNKNPSTPESQTNFYAAAVWILPSPERGIRLLSDVPGQRWLFFRPDSQDPIGGEGVVVRVARELAPKKPIKLYCATDRRLALNK
jgi:hypothetical protein